MLTIPPAVRIFMAVEPADMRRSFDGLAMMVREKIEENPLSGHLFVFRNRRGDRVKILFWDRSGFCIWYKRLEKGVFHFPVPEDMAGRVEIEAAELAIILEGIDLTGARRRARFVPAMGA